MTLSIPTMEMANAHFVTPYLVIGGDKPIDDKVAIDHALELVDTGVTHVLDVRYEAEEARLWSHFPEVTYRWDGIDDAGQRVPARWFERVTTWALETLDDPEAVLLTHCHMGVNRGPSAGYAILLALGWDLVDAIDAIRRVRPFAHVAYAEDALRWHHRSAGAAPATRRTDRERLAEWRRQYPLDVVRLIAQRRAAGE